MELNNIEIGKRIKRSRKEHGFTQERLAEQIGISKNHLSGIERGQYTATTPVIFKLCSILGRTPDYYLIGQISTTTDELFGVLRRLSEDEQQLVIKLINLYLESCK